VKDLDAAKRFYAGLGFTLNPSSRTRAASFVIEENIFAMLLSEPKLRTSSPGTSRHVEGKEAIAACRPPNRAEVEETLAKAWRTAARPGAGARTRLHVRRSASRTPTATSGVMWMDPAAVEQARIWKSPNRR
jgi:predicted lactoylglutathione lyase